MSSYWKVRVDCYYKTRQSQPTPKRKVRFFLCEAEDYDAAKVIALNFAERTSAFGPLLVGMEAPEVYSAKLPMELT